MKAFFHALVIVTVMMVSGCNQQIDRPWVHEPTPDHWLESYWLSTEEHAAKRQWERGNPPKNFADRMTR